MDAAPGSVDTLISSGPPALGRSTSASFVFAATQPSATFACSFDGMAYGECTSPVAVTIDEGDHTFDVRAMAGAASDPSPAHYAWTVDLTGPIVTIGNGPSGTVGATDATFTFSATETATFVCQLDDAAPAACTSPLVLTGLAAGMHSIAIVGTDAVGNAGPGTTQSWTIDTSAPDTTIAAHPAAIVNVTTATFSFSTTKVGSTYECGLDTAGFSACSSPLGYSGLMEGTHTFSVRAVDTFGHPDASPATWTWKIDTTPPTVTIASGPAPGSASGKSVTFTYSSEPGASFECKVEVVSSGGGGRPRPRGARSAAAIDFAACPVAGITYDTLANGQYTFSVRARDAADNVSVVVTRTWMLDATGPTIFLTPFPQDISLGDDKVNYFTEAAAITKCRIGTAQFALCPNDGYPLPSLAPGTYTIEIQGTDTQMNVGPLVSYTWTVKPGATLTSGGVWALFSDAAGVTLGFNHIGAVPSRHWIEPGGSVSALSKQIIGGITYYDITTITGILPNDSIVLPTVFAPAQIGTVNIHGQLPPNTSNIDIESHQGYSVVGSASWTDPFAQKVYRKDADSTGGIPLLVRVFPSSGPILTAWLHSSALVDGVGDATLGTFVPYSTLGATLTNTPSGYTRGTVELAVLHETLDWDIGSGAGPGNSLTFSNAPDPSGYDRLRIIAPLTKPVSSRVLRQCVVLQLAKTTSIAVDFASALPPVDTLTVAVTSSGLASASWSVPAGLASTDGGLIEVSWSQGTNTWRWHVYVSPATTSAASPAIPPSIAEYLIPADAVLSSSLAQYFESTAVSGWDAFRQTPLDDLSSASGCGIDYGLSTYPAGDVTIRWSANTSQ